MDERQEKKQQFETPAAGKGKTLLLAAFIAVAAVVGAGIFLVSGGTGNAGTPLLTAENGIVALPLADVADGKAHYYSYRSDDGSLVRFFLLKSDDGVIRAAFDACDVCYKAKKGYRQEGAVMICNNCNQQFAADRINEVKGGCNPAPLTRTVVGDRVHLDARELNEGRRYFPQS